MMNDAHTFHIPVMGIGFTLETPIKVSKYGISSAMSLVDDGLIEKLRKLYAEKFDLPYQEISNKMDDFRARRITSYLNLVQDIVRKNMDDLKKSFLDKSKDLKNYFSHLPNGDQLLEDYHELMSRLPEKQEIEKWFRQKLTPGSIDVNIMTKVDKINYKDGEVLGHEFNDAHAALRGYAESDLASSVVLSAGMNPRLYSYLGQFDDFFPDENGHIKKKIILKVSDYRSAIIQGKFLAKKGLWVSEYRVESGLNCGGHAFATEGYLMGPVLAEFRDRRQELTQETYDLLKTALTGLGRTLPVNALSLRITAQGGVGTSAEHDFLLEHYELDSVGWGSPFLLVPEVVTIDMGTLELLKNAKEEDLYLSHISPLGVPFNNLKDNSKDQERDQAISKGRPGSPCPKKYVSINTEYTEHAICTASREYQHAKLKELEAMSLSPADLKQAEEKITEKSCICVGLGTGTLLHHGLDTSREGEGVSVCPGPNLAYFDKKFSLKDMLDHIYGQLNIISRKDRPHMFLKELSIYMDYLQKKIEEAVFPLNRKDKKYFINFTRNLMEGIAYYKMIFKQMNLEMEEARASIYEKFEYFYSILKENEAMITKEIK